MSGVETRNLSRDSLFVLAELTVDGQVEGVRVKVRNLSAGGMMAEGDTDIERGERVSVELRRIGTVSGNVAWVQGRRFGVAFDKEIDPKRARPQVQGEKIDVPHYARPKVDASQHKDWNRGIRSI